MKQSIARHPLQIAAGRRPAGYRKSNYSQLADSDSTVKLLNSGTRANHNPDRSLDVHLASDESELLQWLVGATALDYAFDIDNVTQQVVSAKQANPALAATTARPPSNVWVGGTQNNRSQAIYVDLRYALTPTLALHGGLRANDDAKDVSEFQQVNATPIRTANPTAAWSSTPGNIGLEWNLSKDTLAYGKLSTGFKSGAINIGAPTAGQCLLVDHALQP